jgi:hypothetical protein
MPILAEIRSTLLLAFRYLPLLLISFIGFLAIGLGNTALFILFFGHALIVPLVTGLLHMLFSTSNLMSINDVSQLVPLLPSTGESAIGTANIYPTYWMAHISFFFGYLITNAAKILTAETDLRILNNATSRAAVELKIQARKQKAGVLIASLFFFYFLLCFIRYYATGAEHIFGMMISLPLFGIAIGWYYFAEACGATNSDIFGIAMQMMSADTAQDKPKACVYTGTPT